VGYTLNDIGLTAMGDDHAATRIARYRNGCKLCLHSSRGELRT